MRTKTKLFLAIVAMALAWVSAGCSNNVTKVEAPIVRTIVTSDTLLSGMIASLLPPNRYSVEAILPPGQCPGHYDVKLSDIEKMKKATLIVSFRGMPFMNKTKLDERTQLLVDAESRNWMAPDSYRYGLGVLAKELSKRFPEDLHEIRIRKEKAIREGEAEATSLIKRITQAGVPGMPVMASSMQKEPLAWIGFRVVAEYGRQEAMSTREVVRLLEIGKNQRVLMVVDNLQSGPDVGKGIAETLSVPHVVLTNFPSEKGYLETLRENVNVVLSAATREIKKRRSTL
jgi:zinc transport system substrate-binding protein